MTTITSHTSDEYIDKQIVDLSTALDQAEAAIARLGIPPTRPRPVLLLRKTVISRHKGVAS